MCETCGCQGVKPIAELMHEHETLREKFGHVRQRVALGDRTEAARLLGELSAELRAHGLKEERGVLTALRDQGEFAQAVADDLAEHRRLDLALTALDPSAPDFALQVGRVLDDLGEHLDREDLGIFPEAVVTLHADGWDTVEQAHQRV